jgi:enoyl-CoA hydratase/carnithine racemase
MPPVLYEKKGRIAYITLNRPEKSNAANIELAQELGKIWVDLRDDDNLWAAVLSGAGKSFCAGADVGGTPAGAWTISQSISLGDKPIGPSNYRMWKPIVAALHRHVLGAGLWLALECDLRIAADDCLLGLPEPKVGIATIFSGFLPRHIPMAIASELLLLGEPITAQRAYEVGLINKVVRREQLMTEATAVAERLCTNSPLALRAMKELTYRGNSMDFTGIRALAEHVCAPAMNSQDHMEGREAFTQRRKPIWQGK